MSDHERKVQDLERQFPSTSGVAFAAAREQALASGQSVLQSENGFLYEVFPGGRKVLVKQLESPMPVVAGSKFALR